MIVYLPVHLALRPDGPVADVTSDVPGPEPEVVTLRNSSVATAGDYRRFFESNGRHYETGAPRAVGLSLRLIGP